MRTMRGSRGSSSLAASTRRWRWSLERDAPADAHARQELLDGRARRLVRRGGTLVDAPAAHDERAVLVGGRRRHLAPRLDDERLVLRRDDHELASPIRDVGFAEKPVRTDVAVAELPVASLVGDALGLDVVAELEVRHRRGRLAGHELGLEDGSVFLDDPHLEQESVGHLLLGHLADRFLRLDADELVLEHPARSVRMNPERRVVEDARGVALHLGARGLVSP